MKKHLLIICIAVSFIFTAFGSASSALIQDHILLGDQIGTLDVDYMDITLHPEAFLEGSYDVMYVGSAAGHTNLYMDDAVVFATDTSSFGDTDSVLFIEDTTFRDSTDGTPILNINDTAPTNGGIIKLLLLKDWMLDATHTIAAGMMVVGFGDGAGDMDFNDMVIALDSPYKNPIPAPVFMLGCAVVGLVGLRKRTES